MAEKALKFISDNKDNPFFLYLPYPIPYLALQVPDEEVEQYKDLFDDKPYTGNNNYLPHQYPRAAYAAMITRMDRQIGEMMTLLKDLKIDSNTIVIFSSDNGTTHAPGGADPNYFKKRKTPAWS